MNNTLSFISKISGLKEKAQLLADNLEIDLSTCPVEVRSLIDEIKNFDLPVSSEEEEDNRKLFFDLSLDMLCVASFEGQFIELNGSWEQYLGWKPDELYNKPFIELVHPEDRIPTEQAMGKLSNGVEVRNFTNRYLHKDGSYKWLSWYSYPDIDKKLIYAVARDISYLIQAEQDLKDEKNKLRTVIDSIPDHIYIKDEASRFLIVNKAMVEWMEVENEQALIGKTDFDIFTEEHANDAFQDEINIMRTGNPVISKEEKETWPDSPDTWVSTSKLPMFNESGEITGIVGISKDITERKKAEMKLKQAADIVSNMQLGIYIYHLEDINDDSSMRLELANPASEKLTGLPVEKIIGKKIDEAFPGLRELDMPKQFAEVIRTGTPITFEDVFYGDENIKYSVYAVKAFPLPDNKVGVTFDNITTRKLNEEEVKQSKLLLETILDTIPVRVFWKDRELKYLGCNRHFAKDAGLNTPDEIIGKTDYDVGWKEQAELYRTDDKDVLNSEEPKLHYEEPQTTPGGETIWLKTSKIPLRDISGKMIGVLGTYEDITQRKQAEERLKQTNENLEEMVYIASHDLQVPLVSMEGYATELFDNYKEKVDEDGLYCLTRLQSNARRMHKLVLSLLDISRLNTRQYPFETINVNTLTRNIVNDLSLTIDKYSANVHIEKLPHIYADKIRFEGVIRNLLTNSLNYQGKNIIIGFRNNTLFIKDDGIGIPGDQLHKIFKPGERLKMVKTEGVGMGLTFCKKVIEQHHGKIWVESPGLKQGATFFIRLPAQSIKTK